MLGCCRIEEIGGKKSRDAEREREAFTLSYVNFQKLFPVIISIVDCGVIVLLFCC